MFCNLAAFVAEGEVLFIVFTVGIERQLKYCLLSCTFKVGCSLFALLFPGIVCILGLLFSLLGIYLSEFFVKIPEYIDSATAGFLRICKMFVAETMVCCHYSNSAYLFTMTHQICKSIFCKQV